MQEAGAEAVLSLLSVQLGTELPSHQLGSQERRGDAKERRLEQELCFVITSVIRGTGVCISKLL